MLDIPENFTDAIVAHAERRPDSPALIEGAATLSYGDLAALVRKASVYLTELGLAPGDRVGVALSGGADHVVLGLGLMRMGAVPIEIPPHVEPEQMVGLARKFTPARIFVESDAVPLPGVPVTRIDARWRSRIEALEDDRRHGGGEDQLYYISLTSGSTGTPKGVVISHRRAAIMYRMATEMFPEVYSASRPGHFLLAGSLGNSGFFKALRTQLFVGGPIVLLPDFANPAERIRAIAAWDEAVVVVTPRMCRDFIAAAPSQGILFPKARALITVGLPLFSDEKRRAIETVTPNFYDSYGAAAIGTISRLYPAEMLAMPDTVGRAAPETEVEIVDATTALQPPGHVGYLRCRGPSLSTRFWGEDGLGYDGEERFRDGWYYPGDIAAMDAEGYVTLKGRSADVIRRRGREIFPQEVEEVLTAHPNVADAAAVGRPEPERGEEIVAFVVAEGHLDHDSLTAHIVARLPWGRRPDRVFYINELPRLGGGKLDRNHLRQLAIKEVKA